MNSSRHRGFAKVVQTATYAPHFISMVVVVSMINVIFAPTTGIVSSILNKLGIIHGPLTTLMTAEAFPHLYVWSGVWQSLGWDSIIYMGALSSVDDSLHEAALIDGATKWQRIVHIDFAMILPTIVVMLILRSGSILSVGFEKAFLMQNDLNLARSEIIQHVYLVRWASARWPVQLLVRAGTVQFGDQFRNGHAGEFHFQKSDRDFAVVRGEHDVRQ